MTVVIFVQVFDLKVIAKNLGVTCCLCLSYITLRWFFFVGGGYCDGDSVFLCAFSNLQAADNFSSED